ncbi:MAG: YbjQ family protein [Candidatus Nanohaloarchaeota archaeon QJJ-9]|nr:YbjQ family protein [Candidatus Nanohaloarchaeota archaeon QJJ-9]
MQTTNTEKIEGEKIVEDLGLVKGNTVRAKNVGNDIIQGIRNFFGGELKGYSDLMTEAREEALERMEEQAKDKGADAVVNVRFVTSQVANGGSEILAYGTAVKLE